MKKERSVKPAKQVIKPKKSVCEVSHSKPIDVILEDIQNCVGLLRDKIGQAKFERKSFERSQKENINHNSTSRASRSKRAQSNKGPQNVFFLMDQYFRVFKQRTQNIFVLLEFCQKRKQHAGQQESQFIDKAFLQSIGV